MQNNIIPVEYLVARYFVRYAQLDKIIPITFQGSSATQINMYIDLYGIYKTIMSRSYRTDIKDYTSFTSTIINMCSHYRSYFKGLGVYTNFFIISSYNIPEVNTKFVAGYNKTFRSKLQNTAVKEMVELNVELLKLLCPYLPHIYFFETQYESTVLINKLINMEIHKGHTSPEFANIILSSDPYPLQLCHLYNDTVLLKPIKYQSEDNSILSLPKGNPQHDFSLFWLINHGRGKNASERNDIAVSASNLMLVQAMNRFPERNMEHLMQYNSCLKMIHNFIDNKDIKLTPDMMYQSTEIATKIPYSKLDARFKALDIEYQSILYDNDIESKTLSYVDLEDPEALQMINSKYFEKNPIDLLHL